MRREFAIRKVHDRYFLYFINSDNIVEPLIDFGSYSGALWYLKDCVDVIDLLSYDSLCGVAFAREYAHRMGGICH